MMSCRNSLYFRLPSPLILFRVPDFPPALAFRGTDRRDDVNQKKKDDYNYCGVVFSSSSYPFADVSS